MCFFCDGGTTDEYHRKVSDDIDDPGWHLIGVEARPMWGYTIGLLERFGHPELVAVDECCWDHLAAGLNVIGDRVRAGQRFLPGDDIFDVDGTCKARVGAVHPDEWTTDRFAAWLDYYGTRPWRPPPPSAVQLLWVRRSGLWQDDVANRRWPADDLSFRQATVRWCGRALAGRSGAVPITRPGGAARRGPTPDGAPQGYEPHPVTV